MEGKKIGQLKHWWEGKKAKFTKKVEALKMRLTSLLGSPKLTTSLALLLLSILFFAIGGLTVLDTIFFALGAVAVIGALLFFILWLVEKARSAPAPTN